MCTYSDLHVLYYIDIDPKYYGNISGVLNSNKPYMVSVAGLTQADNLTIVDYLNDQPHVSAIELNLSCPVPHGGAEVFSQPKQVAKITQKIKI